MNKAFARLRTAALAAAVVLGSAVVAHAETVLHRGNSAEPGTLDPHKASGTWENNILGDLFLGLTTEAAFGTPMGTRRVSTVTVRSRAHRIAIHPS